MRLQNYILRFLSYVLFTAFLLGSSQAYASICNGILNPSSATQQAPARNETITLSETYSALAEKRLLLRQNASFLPSNFCGGTCVTTSTVNAMLAIAEALQPGRITGLSHPSLFHDESAGPEPGTIQELQLNLVKTILAKLSERGIDGTRGANLETVGQFFSEVYHQFFGDTDVKINYGPNTIYYMSDHESVSFSGATLMLMAVEAEESSHAIVVNGVHKARTFISRYSLSVSDPHDPNNIKRQPVVKHVKNSLHLVGYGKSAERVYIRDFDPKEMSSERLPKQNPEGYDNFLFEEDTAGNSISTTIDRSTSDDLWRTQSVGQIRYFVTVSLEVNEPEVKGPWSKHAVLRLLSTYSSGAIRANIHLKEGLTLGGVYLSEELTNTAGLDVSLLYRTRFSNKSFAINVNDIYDIEVIKEAQP